MGQIFLTLPQLPTWLYCPLSPRYNWYWVVFPWL